MISSRVKGISWFVFQCFTVSVTLAVVRFAIKDINIFVMVFIQSSFSFAIILPIIFRKGFASGIEYLKTKRPVLHVTRTILGLAGTTCFFYGVTKIPLGDATAISFTGPLFTTIAAALVLREKLRLHRFIGLVLGFAGALIVLHPGVGVFNPYVIYIIITVVLMGIVQVLIAMLNKTEPAQRMLFYMILLSLIMTAPLAATHWVTPQLENLGWIFMLSLLTYINVFSVIMAYRYTEIGTLMPFDFTRLLFTSIIAYLIFHEVLNIATVLGSLVILAGVAYVMHKERRKTNITDKVLNAPRLDNH